MNSVFSIAYEMGLCKTTHSIGLVQALTWGKALAAFSLNPVALPACSAKGQEKLARFSPREWCEGAALTLHHSHPSGPQVMYNESRDTSGT